MARGEAVSSSGARAGVIALCAAAAMLAIAGCASKARRDGRGPAASTPPADVTLRFNAIVSAHNARAAMLETLVVPAATVLRYPEGDSVAEDQLDGFISLTSRGRGAFELKSAALGKTWAWLGGDGVRSWIYFAAMERPSVLHVYEGLANGTSTEAGAVVGGAELTLLTPESLRLLLGIAPIGEVWSLASVAQPAEAVSTPAGGAEPTDRYEIRWSVTSQAVARMRVGADGTPVEIVVEDGSGSVVARARHSEPVRVRRDGIAMGAWPLLARRIEIVAPRSNSSATLQLDGDVLARPTRTPKDRFFDLAELQTYLAPEEVVVHDPSGVVRPPRPAAPPPSNRGAPSRKRASNAGYAQ